MKTKFSQHISRALIIALFQCRLGRENPFEIESFHFENFATGRNPALPE